MAEQLELRNEDIWDDTELIKLYDKGLKQWRKEKEQLSISSEDNVPEIGQWTTVNETNTEEFPVDPTNDAGFWDEYELTRSYYKAIKGDLIYPNQIILENEDQNIEEVYPTDNETESLQALFSVGSFCRSLYEEDGAMYEAKITEICGDVAIVQFIGFENEEQVALKDLLPTLGNEQRELQIQEAKKLTETTKSETNPQL